MIDEADESILRYILQTPGATAKIIRRDVFEEGQSKERYVYRKLNLLIDLGYLQTSLMYPERGASSPKLYFLTVRGAHVIGEKMPRDHAKFQRRDFRNMARVKGYLATLARRKDWYLIEENEDCRIILAKELKKATVKKYGKAEADYIYLNQIPPKVDPDLVLFTGKEAYIVILSHPHGGRGAFKTRIKKYERVINFFEFMCFTLNEDQKTLWIDVLNDYDLYHKTAYKGRFKIYGPEEFD